MTSPRAVEGDYKGCSVANCTGIYRAKGFCNKHWHKWNKYGNPLIVLQNMAGTGSKTKKGYIVRTENGTAQYEHIRIAETVFGKMLPPMAEVHHANQDKSDNRNCNLVICQDKKYHSLLHVRARALKAGYSADHRKCTFCKKYDSPSALRVRRGRTFYHVTCENMNQWLRSIGLRKAKAVDDCIDAIRAWIDKQEGQTRHGKPTGKQFRPDDDIPF